MKRGKRKGKRGRPKVLKDYVKVPVNIELEAVHKIIPDLQHLWEKGNEKGKEADLKY